MGRGEERVDSTLIDVQVKGSLNPASQLIFFSAPWGDLPLKKDRGNLDEEVMRGF
jgi:hypothetical protein